MTFTGPPRDRRLRLGAALRERPARRRRHAQRRADRAPHRSLRALRAAGDRPAPGRAERPRGPRRQPQGPENPREGWWNWGGITRPVTLVPKGRVALDDAAVLTRSLAPDRRDDALRRLGDQPQRRAPDPHDRGGAALAARRPRRPRSATASARWRRGSGGACGSSSPWPARRCGRPTTRRSTPSGSTRWPAAASSSATCARSGSAPSGRSAGRLELNGRPVQLRGASIQEDVGGARRRADDGGLRLDRRQAQGAARQRDARALPARRAAAAPARPGGDPGLEPGADLPPRHGARHPGRAGASALATLRGTVLAARRHPSVLTHSVANELSTVPDTVPGVRDLRRRGAAPRRGPRPDGPAVDRPAQLPGLPARGDLRGVPAAGDQLLLRLVPRQAGPPGRQHRRLRARTCAGCSASTRRRPRS